MAWKMSQVVTQLYILHMFHFIASFVKILYHILGIWLFTEPWTLGWNIKLPLYLRVWIVYKEETTCTFNHTNYEVDSWFISWIGPATTQSKLALYVPSNLVQNTTLYVGLFPNIEAFHYVPTQTTVTSAFFIKQPGGCMASKGLWSRSSKIFLALLIHLLVYGL